VATPQTFDGSLEKVRSFVMRCKLYLRIRMKEVMIEEKFSRCYHMCRKEQEIYKKKM